MSYIFAKLTSFTTTARTKPTLNATQQAERKVEDAIEEACGFGSLEFLETLLAAKMGNSSQPRFIERAIANNNLQVVQLLLRKTKVNALTLLCSRPTLTLLSHTTATTKSNKPIIDAIEKGSEPLFFGYYKGTSQIRR